MATVYMDVKGPDSLDQLVGAISGSSHPPPNNFTATVEIDKSGLTAKVDFQRTALRPYSIDIDGQTNKDTYLHRAAIRVVRALNKRGWDVRVIPTFTSFCGRDENCPVCHWESADPMLDWDELARDVVAEADLDDSVCADVQLLLDSDNLETIAIAALGTRTPLSPYLVWRIRQVITLGVYRPERARQLFEVLAEKAPEEDEREVERDSIAESIAADLVAAIELSKPDRDSIEMDIEAQDFTSAIFDGVLNSRSAIPPTLLARIRDISARGIFGESTNRLMNALKSNEETAPGAPPMNPEPRSDWQGPEVEEDRVGRAFSPMAPKRVQSGAHGEALVGFPSPTDTDTRLEMSLFAARLNHLFDTTEPACSSGEAAASIRRSGFLITVSTVSQLRSGIGPTPSRVTIEALAGFFGVEPAYFYADSAGGDMRWGHSALQTPADTAETVETEQIAESQTPETPPSGGPSSESANVAAADEIAEVSPAGGNDIWGLVVGDDLEDIAAICKIRADGCWIRSSHRAVRCRPRGDVRTTLYLPKMELHRWAWMVDNGLSEEAISRSLIHIRRTCDSPTCCNPRHLVAVTRGGDQLSRSDVAHLLRKSLAPSNRPATPAIEVIEGGSAREGRLILEEDLALIREYCDIDTAGCWIAPSANPVAVRARGDSRAVSDLPALAPHRWVWMVVHGRASDPLPGNAFYVRRRCEKQRCCKPEHLYLTTPQGQEFTRDQVERLCRPRGTRSQAITPQRNPIRPPDLLGDGGRYRELQRENHSNGLRTDSPAPGPVRSSQDLALFADRLNKLFEITSGPAGIPFSSGEVAAALQEDGLNVSQTLITRVRDGLGDYPSKQTIEALAYFFNVDLDYFSATVQPEEAERSSPTTAVDTDPPALQPSAIPTTSRVQVIRISVADLGRMITGLSEAVSGCLSASPTEIQAAGRLLPLLAELGEHLQLPYDDRLDNRVIGRPLLRRVVTEWKAVGQEPKHDRLLARLSALVED